MKMNKEKWNSLSTPHPRHLFPFQVCGKLLSSDRRRVFIQEVGGGGRRGFENCLRNFSSNSRAFREKELMKKY